MTDYDGNDHDNIGSHIDPAGFGGNGSGVSYTEPEKEKNKGRGISYL